MTHKVYIAGDYRGSAWLDKVSAWLTAHGYETEVLGCTLPEGFDANTDDTCDYSEWGKLLAEKVVADKGSLGIAMCGSGNGICMAVNRVKGARGALVKDLEMAESVREHNGANVICLPTMQTLYAPLEEILEKIMTTQPDGLDRHVRIWDKLDM